MENMIIIKKRKILKEINLCAGLSKSPLLSSIIVGVYLGPGIWWSFTGPVPPNMQLVSNIILCL